MEEHERQSLVEHLNHSRDRLLSLVEGFTPEEWAFHPSEGRWSIGDCVEHVTRVENRILGLMAQKIEQPPEPEKQDPSHAKDSQLLQIVPDRTERRQAPAVAHPTGEWSDPKELMMQFRCARERTMAFASTTDKDLRNYFIPHPAFGELDCYQWLLVLSLHGERHSRQITEIVEDPAFPKRN